MTLPSPRLKRVTISKYYAVKPHNVLTLHVFGISETKLKQHKMTNAFQIEGYQTPFRKDNTTNNGGGLLVYVKKGIHVKRREDLETYDISCIWLEIIQEKGKSFLIGNLYRPPDSRIEYNDRFEDFMDKVSNEGKEIILMGDFNKKNYALTIVTRIG